MMVTAIDGAGSILGSAGPCILRNSTYLPIVASMKFDSVDMSMMVARGTLNGVVLHEMMHTLGFGTIWGPEWRGEVAQPDLRAVHEALAKDAARADGSKLWVHWSATPVRSARGSIEY